MCVCMYICCISCADIVYLRCINWDGAGARGAAKEDTAGAKATARARATAVGQKTEAGEEARILDRG